MSTLVFDIETNGLLHCKKEEKGDKIHCIVTQDAETLEVLQYYADDKEIYKGLLSLYNADCIVGHNILNFDIPFIQSLFPRWKYKNAYDTFLLSCLFNSNRAPNAHSIEAYSGGRKVPITDWRCLTYEILDRCTIDVIVNTEIYLDFLPRIQEERWKEAIQLEQQVAINHVKQVAAGVDVDIPLLLHTVECLDAELEALGSLIEDNIKYRCIPGEQYKKVFKKDGDLQPYVKNYFDGEVASCVV